MSPTELTPRSVVRFGLGLVGIIGVIAGVGAVLRDPIAAFSARLVGAYGVPGLFAAFVATDQVPGLGFQPVMFLGYTGGVGPATLFLLSWLATLCASVLVYAVGSFVRGHPGAVGFLVRWRIGQWLQDHGVRAIAVAAVAPFPFVLATFGAGVMGVRFRDLVVGAAFRGLKLAFTLVAIMAGWGIAA